MWWTVEDFKGLSRGSIDLSSGVLTILAGPNSSGKSSLIQSILLSTQSVRNEGPLVLNGPLVRLGESKDLVRKGAKSTQIILDMDRADLPGWDELVEEHGTPGGRLTATVELRANPQDSDVSIHSLRIESTEYPGQPLYLTKENRRASDVSKVMGWESSTEVDILHLKSVLGSSERVLRTYVSFMGMTPVALYQISSEDRIARDYASAAVAMAKQQFRGNAARPKLSQTPMTAYAIESEIAELARKSLSSRELQQLVRRGKLRKDGAFAPDFISRLSELDPTTLAEYAAKVAAERSRRPYKRIPLRPYGGRQNGLPPWWRLGLLEQGLFTHFTSSMRVLAEYAAAIEGTASSVQYLGPLRDEPRVIWSQWNEQDQGLPVGARGELSAAVLARRGQREVTYHSTRGEEHKASLISAVNEWIAYLDIGESVGVKSKGKLGVGLELAVAGEMRDLTSVGVGVSQALPLIVAVLSVPKHSIFIVEQPELHLHPAVQARLADFFSVARPDLSIVVESHSEAFLTRLRRRVAERSVEPDRIRIFFVESGALGSSTRELVVDKFGDLSEWPTGFLMADDDATAILKANLESVMGGGKQ